MKPWIQVEDKEEGLGEKQPLRYGPDPLLSVRGCDFSLLSLLSRRGPSIQIKSHREKPYPWRRW